MRRAFANLLVTLFVVLVVPIGTYAFVSWFAEAFTSLSSDLIMQISSKAGAAGVVLGFILGHRTIRGPRQSHSMNLRH